MSMILKDITFFKSELKNQGSFRNNFTVLVDCIKDLSISKSKTISEQEMWMNMKVCLANN